MKRITTLHALLCAATLVAAAPHDPDQAAHYTAYVSNERDGTIGVIDLTTRKVPRTIEVVDEPLRDDAGKMRRSALRAAPSLKVRCSIS